MNQKVNHYVNRLLEMDCTEREQVKQLLRKVDYLTGKTCAGDGPKHPELTIGDVKGKLHEMGIRFSICPGLHLTVNKPHYGSCQEDDETTDVYLRRVLWTNEQMAGYSDD